MAGCKRNGIATLVAKATGHRGSARLNSCPHACFRESCPISLNRQAIDAVAVLGRAAFALDRNSGGAVFCTPRLSAGRKPAHHVCPCARRLAWHGRLERAWDRQTGTERLASFTRRQRGPRPCPARGLGYRHLSFVGVGPGAVNLRE